VAIMKCKYGAIRRDENDIPLCTYKLRKYLEKMNQGAQQVELVVPELQDRNARKHETAYADGVRFAVRELLNALGLSPTWLEHIQMLEATKKGYKNFGYNAQDGTFYFGFFKNKRAFVEVVLEDVGATEGRVWVSNRIGTFDDNKYGIEAWVNLGRLCKVEVEEQ